MGLNVGVVGFEQCLRAINRKLLGDVNKFAAAVIALARITFRVFVGQHGALRFKHGGADVIFRSDEFDVIFLTLAFFLYGQRQFGIRCSERLINTEHGLYF